MASRDHLVPETRTDRNGVPSIRWVKPSAGSGAKATKIPAVTGSPDKATPVIDKLIGSIKSVAAANISQKAKELLEQAIVESGENSPRTSWIKTELTRLAIPPIRSADLNNLAAFSSSAPDEWNNSFWLAVEGLRYEQGFSEIDDYLTRATPEKLAKARAFVYAVLRLGDDWAEFLGGREDHYGSDSDDDDDDEYGDGGGSYYEDEAQDEAYEPEHYSMHNRDLYLLIMQHPDKVEEIVSDIESGVRDVELLRARALHPQTALRDGVL